MGKLILLENLCPNQWFLNKLKVEKIRNLWDRGLQTSLPSVLASPIDGELALIDGNTRAFVAWERGEKNILAVTKELSDIDDKGLLYEFLHREGKKKGIRSLCDLSEKILEPQDYQKKWIEFCCHLQKELEGNIR